MRIEDTRLQHECEKKHAELAALLGTLLDPQKFSTYRQDG
jgi:hypothetical protein